MALKVILCPKDVSHLLAQQVFEFKVTAIRRRQLSGFPSCDRSCKYQLQVVLSQNGYNILECPWRRTSKCNCFANVPASRNLYTLTNSAQNFRDRVEPPFQQRWRWRQPTADNSNLCRLLVMFPLGQDRWRTAVALSGGQPRRCVETTGPPCVDHRLSTAAKLFFA